MNEYKHLRKRNIKIFVSLISRSSLGEIGISLYAVVKVYNSYTRRVFAACLHQLSRNAVAI